jgi:hypothetical protein
VTHNQEIFEMNEVYEELLKTYDIATAERIVRYAQKATNRKVTFRQAIVRAIEVVTLPTLY